ncbi:redoxin domain-containing protein [Phormidium sp. LEGE 05292]|uniref:thioredoxin domain-containing protein n=1 Tax=[Phormidium] sp. LEGE 05292 TaxID=767427 RepID=UPI00187DDCE0|nr:thioredoxin domain-containing protein [Phormidium sp. LEGE 05292]MBE9225915.1 redoxin domain-containing protein [Phormidium sp. LEGE 05292]
MRKPSALLLGLCISSLVFSASLVTATTARTAVKTDTAIAQANPCAAKPNPCAGKLKNVGGPLAKELQGKPVVVDIFATWCPACKTLEPTLSQLRREYTGKANFVVLDVSDKAKTMRSEARARQLGLEKFFAGNKSKTATVAIIDPATGNILVQHSKNPSKAAYTSVLNSAIAKR